MRTLFAFGLFVFVTGTSLAGQVFPPPRTPRRPVQETNIYLVTFRGNVPPSERAAAVQAAGARLRVLYRAANAASVEIPDAAVLARLRSDSRLSSIFMNRPMTLLAGQ